MIVGQVLVLIAVYGAVRQPACSKFSADVCPLGTWCREKQGICMWCAFWYRSMCEEFLTTNSWREHVVDWYNSTTSGTSATSSSTSVLQLSSTEEFHLSTTYFTPRKKQADVVNNREKDSLSIALDGTEGTDLPGMCYGCMRALHEPDLNRVSVNRPADFAGFNAKRQFITTENADVLNVQELNRDAYLVIFASSLIVALAICRELKDVHLCRLMILRHDEDVDHDARALSTSPGGSSSSSRVNRFILLAGCYFRRFGLVALVTMSIPALITHRGRDALAICVNAVAILFLLEIDNFVYDFLISEKLTGSFEIATRLDLHLTPQDAMQLRVQKLTHLCFIPCAVLVNLGLVGTTYDTWAIPGHAGGAVKEWAILAITIAMATAFPALIEDIAVEKMAATVEPPDGASTPVKDIGQPYAAGAPTPENKGSADAAADVTTVQTATRSTSRTRFEVLVANSALKHLLAFLGRLLFGFVTVAIASFLTWAR
ncbi:unnamed protein product [Amoebophrya sp. A120]|nr:unnamed protein product [Amoebophrya sp. A120]|eukprot:GSA120T00007484001.1